MSRAVELEVELIAWTAFEAPSSTEWRPELATRLRPIEGDGEDLVEFAGRACYESWNRPNPRTAQRADYIGHILAVEHGSVLEHGQATFYIRGVSRSLTHELVRHRHFSYSQLSQRYVDSGDINWVIPPEMRDNDEIARVLARQMAGALNTYDNLFRIMAARFEEDGVTGTEARKRARQAARAVLPNMTETRIVVTGNYRAWREFLAKRATVHADTEIRELALRIYRTLATLAPAVVQDFELATAAPSGVEVLHQS